ncbi:PsiF family protein [Lacticaseibacillus rhamnosus]
MRDCMKPQRDACRSQAVAKALPKGPDRKAFMHQCLGGAVAAAH